MKYCLLLLLALIQFNLQGQPVFPDDFRKGGAEIGSTFPAISLQPLEGDEAAPLALKNKVVWVNYWFVGCTGCRQEEAFLKEISDHFKGNDKVEFVSITPSDPEAVKGYLEKHGDFGFPVYLQDGFKEAKKNFNVKGFPTNQLLVNRVVVENVRIPIAQESMRDWMIHKIQEEADKL